MPAPEPADQPADLSAPPDPDLQDYAAGLLDEVSDDDSHPLGPIGASLDKAVDRIWDRLRGNPAMDRLFYTASELGDFSLSWHLLGTARGVATRGGTREAARLALALGPSRHWSTAP